MSDNTKTFAQAQRDRPWPVLAGYAIQFLLLCNCFYWAQQPFRLRLPNNSLDGSWIAVLGEAATRGLQWGVDIVCTFGPASILATNYYTASYSKLNLGFGLVISIVMAACSALVVWRGDRPWSLDLLATLMLAVAMTLMALSRDAFQLACALIVFFLGFRAAESGWICRAAAVCGAAVLGIFAMSKSTMLIGSLVLLLMADANLVLHRRVPMLTAILLLCATLTYLAFGQSFAALPRFVALQAEMVLGYAEAMSLRGSSRELGLFLLLSALLGALLGVLVLRFERAGAASSSSWISVALLVAGFSASWLLAFKAGFVRQDNHTIIAWQTVGFGAMLYAFARPWPRLLAPRYALFGLLAWGFIMVAVIAPLRWAYLPGQTFARLGEIYHLTLLLDPSRHWSAAAAYLSDPSRWQAEAAAAKERAWNNIQQARPLPKLVGSVDIIPSEQTAVLAHGLNYIPRPVFQEYFGYTPRLVEANRVHLHGPRAADWLIFAPGSIDGRYPSSADGALWPDFLSAYEPDSITRDLLFLRRRSQPLSGLLGPSRHIDARMGEMLSVDTDRPVFARFVLRKTILGRILGFLYRPPEVSINVTLRSGAQLQYRLIPEMAASGFLLSPRVATVRSYLAVALGDLLDYEQVATVRIEVSRHGWWAYSDRIHAEFSAIDTEALRRAARAGPLRQEIAVQDRLARIMLNSGVEPSYRFGIVNEGLLALPPTSINLDVPAGAQRLTIRFGIVDAAWRYALTDGVCFRVSDPMAPAGADVLFERCLRPVTADNDRGDQTANIELSPTPDQRLRLETTCLNSCDGDWSYWNAIELQ
jgi:hypothetical protein